MPRLGLYLPLYPFSQKSLIRSAILLVRTKTKAIIVVFSSLVCLARYSVPVSVLARQYFCKISIRSWIVLRTSSAVEWAKVLDTGSQRRSSQLVFLAVSRCYRQHKTYYVLRCSDNTACTVPMQSIL